MARRNATSRTRARRRRQQSRRRPFTVTVRGRGDYSEAREMDTLNRIAKLEERIEPGPTPFGDTGYTIGSKFGKFGGKMGRLGGTAIGHLFGSGAYGDTAMFNPVKLPRPREKIFNSTNSLFPNGPITAGVPDFKYSGVEGLQISEKEYLGDILASSTIGAFNIQKFSINPGQSDTFPWLSVIANNFDSYTVEQCAFTFVSTSSEFNGTSQALGTVIMAMDYDVTDPLYLNKSEMAHADQSKSERVSENCTLGVECARAYQPFNQYYVRNDSTAATGADLRLSDYANFSIATQGCSTASVNLGELWVTYTITFYKKQLSTLIGGFGSAQFTSISTAKNAPFDAPQTLDPDSTLNVIASGPSLLFPIAGRWLVSMDFTGTGATNTSPTFGGTATVTTIGTKVNSGSTVAGWLGIVDTTAYGGAANITVNATATLTTLTGTNTRIASYNLGLS